MSLIGELRAGDFAGALRKIQSEVGDFLSAAPSVLETFAKQFASDFGLDMLNKAEVLAPQVLSGAVTIQQAGATLLAQAGVEAVTDAEKDGTVALNALRVQIEAQKATAAAVQAPVAVAPTEVPAA